ncbi:unnamed protein product [Rotaria sp. Silwood1]|nr:unnamed protein product [Rotaria sp. Silwood1]CAF3815871.1 unnamed protein product [Rotaria sp. Silwood1]CAF3866017.1 unnamed protein product [Rotaria sp. Silwood1]CAF4654208.1 unnamed protein product [Rotaria sp. Silwood1]CAF4828206.1 unnamed protein product [Rotaria sp. Silwood1]
MAKRATTADRSPSDTDSETSPQRLNKKESITNYVTDVLTKHGQNVGEQVDLSQAQVKISTKPSTDSDYENISAFRRYPFDTEVKSRTDAQRSREQSQNSDDEFRDPSSTQRSTGFDDSITELNLDPNPIHEERESQEQVYKQKVYLRQLQPPTPQPMEIQVQEVLIKPPTQKPPIHVHVVGQRQPPTPPPITIKTQPPPPPPPESSQPIVYNKYIPPPKQPPPQIIIHRYPDMPPKPRPIIVEQWLPYKPAPKRIIKHSLPREALQTPPPPHNIIISYSKPRAVIEVELVRLPVVKIDPQVYEQMSAAGQQQLMRNPPFQHEQNYVSGNRSATTPNDENGIDWRI